MKHKAFGKDQPTRELELKSVARERVRKHRDSLRAQGLRPIQIWVPVPAGPISRKRRDFSAFGFARSTGEGNPRLDRRDDGLLRMGLNRGYIAVVVAPGDSGKAEARAGSPIQCISTYCLGRGRATHNRPSPERSAVPNP